MWGSRLVWGAGAVVAVLLIGPACSPDPVREPSTTAPSPAASPASATAAPPPLTRAELAAVKRAIERGLDSPDAGLESVEAVLVGVDGSGQVAVYRNRKPGDHAHVWSVTKSVVSILVGIAIDEGKLRLDQTLAELLPDDRPQMSDEVAAITLQQLLTMTAGFPANDQQDTFTLDNPDIVGQTLVLGLTTTPGEEFVYSNSTGHLVAAVLAHAVGRGVLEYARVKLFDPLEIDTRPAYQGSDVGDPAGRFHRAAFAWAADVSGLNAGCYGLKVTAEDMAKLGRLYLGGGRWGGRQIVSAEWVETSTSRQVVPEGSDLFDGYGYFWWLGEHDGRRYFAASGAAGQLILVSPELHLVAVVSSRDTADPDPLPAALSMIEDLAITRSR
jgi:CubicO group peptidase (beta-lactamase class C family)